MKSFPSTLNEAQNMYGSTRSQSFEATFDIERIKHGALNLNKSIPVVQEMLKQTNINISNYQKYPNMRTVANPSTMISGSSRDYKNIGEREYEGTEYNKDGSQKTVKYKGMDGDMVSEDREEAIFYENPLQLPADIIALAKDYDWVYQNRVKSVETEIGAIYNVKER